MAIPFPILKAFLSSGPPPFTDTISAEIPDLSRLWLPWDWPLSTHAWGPRPTKLSNQSPSWKTNKKWPSRDFPRSILRFVSPSFLLWISGRLLTSVQNVKCYLQPSVARHAESEDSETLQNMFSSQPQSSDVHRVDFSLRGTQLLKDHFLQSASGSPWIYHFHGKLLQKFNLISSSPIEQVGRCHLCHGHGHPLTVKAWINRRRCTHAQA